MILLGELLVVGISRRVPLRVRHQRELLVQLIALEHVRAGGHRVQLVVAAGVLGRGDRGAVRERERVGQVGEGLRQVEHERGRVRGLDRGQAHQVLRPVLVRARVLRVGEIDLVVARSVGHHRPVVGALDRVLHVLGGDDRAVLVLDVRLDVERPGQPVIADRAHVRGQARHDLRAGSRTRLEGEHRHGPQVVQVQHPRVVGVARVERVRRAAAVQDQGPPLGVEGLTTPVTPALNAADPVLDVALPLPLLLPLLLQALMTRAASAPSRRRREGTASLHAVKRLLFTGSHQGRVPLVTGSSDPARRAARLRIG